MSCDHGGLYTTLGPGRWVLVPKEKPCLMDKRTYLLIKLLVEKERNEEIKVRPGDPWPDWKLVQGYVGFPTLLP